jgi:hypothetical protein
VTIPDSGIIFVTDLPHLVVLSIYEEAFIVLVILSIIMIITTIIPYITSGKINISSLVKSNSNDNNLNFHLNEKSYITFSYMKSRYLS